MSSKRQLLRTSAVVGAFSFLGNITGIIVETAIAARLGLSRSSDTFYVAFTVPYIIISLIGATGQFSLVPFFAGLESQRDERSFWRGFSYVFNLVLLGGCGVAAVGGLAAPWIVRGIAPGFTHEQTAVASDLARWLFLMIIPAALAEVFRSFLYSQHRFAFAAASNVFRNASVIAGVVFLFHRYGLYSIVLGYLAGVLLQLLVLGGKILLSFPVRYSATLAGTGKAFRTLRGAGAAQLISSAAWQVVVVIERIIASFLPPGSITALNYGFKVMTTLSELLSGSVGTVAFPALSRAVVRREDQEQRRIFQDVVELSTMIALPVMVFCLTLSRNIIKLVFERGNFTSEAAILMATVFFYYSLSLLSFSYFRIFTFYLFAKQQAAGFIRFALLQYTVTVLSDLFYVVVLRLGAPGIPLGLFTGLMAASAFALRSNLAGVREILDRPFGLFIVKNLAGAGLTAVAIVSLRYFVRLPSSGMGNFFTLCILCGIGSAVFFGVLAASRAIPLAEFAEVWRSHTPEAD